MAILIAILVALLAVAWGYLTFTSRQSEDLGYLVRGNGCGIENAAGQKPECRSGQEPGRRTGYDAEAEQACGTKSDFREVEMAGTKDEEKEGGLPWLTPFI